MFASPFDLCAAATFVSLTVPNNIIIPAVAVILKKHSESSGLCQAAPIHTYMLFP